MHFLIVHDQRIKERNYALQLRFEMEDGILVYENDDGIEEDEIYAFFY